MRTPKELKITFKNIDSDREKNLVPSIHDIQVIQNYWQAYIEGDGYYFPYTTTIDMINDLKKYFNA